MLVAIDQACPGAARDTYRACRSLDNVGYKISHFQGSEGVRLSDALAGMPRPGEIEGNVFS